MQFAGTMHHSRHPSIKTLINLYDQILAFLSAPPKHSIGQVNSPARKTSLDGKMPVSSVVPCHFAHLHGNVQCCYLWTVEVHLSRETGSGLIYLVVHK